MVEETLADQSSAGLNNSQPLWMWGLAWVGVNAPRPLWCAWVGARCFLYFFLRLLSSPIAFCRFGDSPLPIITHIYIYAGYMCSRARAFWPPPQIVAYHPPIRPLVSAALHLRADICTPGPLFGPSVRKERLAVSFHLLGTPDLHTCRRTNEPQPKK